MQKLQNPEETDMDAVRNSVEARVRTFREQSGEVRSGIFSELLVLYRPLLESLVSKSCRVAVENGLFHDTDLARQELSEEANIALWRAAMTYRDENRTTFGLYAKICIRNRLISCLRRERNSLPAADAEDALFEVPDPDADPEERYAVKESFADYYRRFTDSLTEYEQSVFRLYIAGASYKQIAKRLCTNEKSVGNAVYRLRKKLKDTMR